MNSQMINSVMLEEIQTRYQQGTRIIGEAQQQALLIERPFLITVLQDLKTEEPYQFNMLRNLSAVDFIEYFEVVYHLYSLPLRHAITIKTRCPSEGPEVPSVTGIFPSANFQEREIYDLLGIKFAGHPDLRRILMPDEFTGHPLRKSYKLGSAATGRGN